MLIPSTYLKIVYQNGANFTDYSQALNDVTRDEVTLGVQNVDTLYIGYHKPIDRLYVDLPTPNTVQNTLSVKYFNGTSYVEVDSMLDETKGFTRSGFVRWIREYDDQAKSTVDGDEMYWYAIQPSSTHSATVFNWINLIFADDRDLVEQIPEILSTAHLGSKKSHILAHVAAKKFIIQEIRNANYGKRDADGKFQDINAWDLLDIDQINQAATFKALSIMYFNYSDEPGDNYSVKSKSFNNKYSTAMSLAVLQLDLDDDGKVDTGERTLEGPNRRFRR